MQLHWLPPDNRNEAFRFYKQFMPYSHIAQKEKLAVLFADNEQQEIIAAVRVRPIGPYQLLTGMLVHPEYRGKGIAHQMMLSLATTFANTPSFLFALPHLCDFYRQHGFESDQQVPAEIHALFKRYSNQGKTLCLMRHHSAKLHSPL